jgi:hypothetical protein
MSQRCRDFQVSPAPSLTTVKFSLPIAARQASLGWMLRRSKPRLRSRRAHACIGDEQENPTLHAFGLNDRTQVSIDLPGRPRWCVTDAEAKRLFLCIREPSMVMVVSLPDLSPVARWRLPSGGAHGLDIDHSRGRLYAACDDGALVEIDSTSGEVTNVWPIAGSPDVTFFNPSTGYVHVAIGEPGLIETINPQTGTAIQTMTGVGAHTTALVVPDQLFVISPAHGGILVLADA